MAPEWERPNKALAGISNPPLIIRKSIDRDTIYGRLVAIFMTNSRGAKGPEREPIGGFMGVVLEWHTRPSKWAKMAVGGWIYGGSLG